MDKVTIYAKSDFGLGVNAYEARLVGHGTRKWAQYAAAPYVDFVPKRARKARRIQQSYRPHLLIVEGWNAPSPQETFVPVCDSPTVSVSRGRYSACDPRWESDFNAMIDARIADGTVRVVADYRTK